MTFPMPFRQGEVQSKRTNSVVFPIESARYLNGIKVPTHSFCLGSLIKPCFASVLIFLKLLIAFLCLLWEFGNNDPRLNQPLLCLFYFKICYLRGYFVLWVTTTCSKLVICLLHPFLQVVNIITFDVC